MPPLLQFLRCASQRLQTARQNSIYPSSTLHTVLYPQIHFIIIAKSVMVKSVKRFQYKICHCVCRVRFAVSRPAPAPQAVFSSVPSSAYFLQSRKPPAALRQFLLRIFRTGNRRCAPPAPAMGHINKFGADSKGFCRGKPAGLAYYNIGAAQKLGQFCYKIKHHYAGQRHFFSFSAKFLLCPVTAAIFKPLISRHSVSARKSSGIGKRPSPPPITRHKVSSAA